MDYFKAPLIFKIKKVARYIRIFGFTRTYIKVLGQKHMRSEESFDGDTWINHKGKNTGDVAIVGCGNFGFSTIGYYLTKSTSAQIKYALDIDKSRARSLATKYRAYYATVDFESILADEEVRMIYISSNHHSHALYAIKAIEDIL